MAVTNGWGQGTQENTIQWGRGATNATNDWGSIYADSPSGDTVLNAETFSNAYSTEFDGVDDYVVSNATYSELNGTTKATWSYWVKPTLGSAMVLSRVSSTTSTSAFVYMFYLFSNGEVGAAIGDTTRRARTGSTLLTDNVWSHILVCYDGTLSNGSKTKIFINGVDSTNSDSTTAPILVNANYPLSIGRRDQTPTYYYDGLMDELAMWNSTDFRTQSDVDTIYNSGSASDLNNNGLTAPTTWYRFEEGSGTNATDSGSGGNDGTLTNGVTYSTDIP